MTIQKSTVFSHFFIKKYDLLVVTKTLVCFSKINQHKKESHFLYNTKEDVPNIELFTTKYQNFKNNDFNLGYYIHLYTDKIWFDEFLEKLTYSNSIKLLDGTILATTHDEIRNLIYKDYTNLNIKLIDEYTIDLSLFYEDFQIPETTLDEIPIDKLNILIDQMGIIIENSKQEKNYVFDIYLINEFINNCIVQILDELKNY